MDSPKDALARIKRAFAAPLIDPESLGRERRRADSDPTRFSPCGRKINQPGIDWRFHAGSASPDDASGSAPAEEFSLAFRDPLRLALLSASIRPYRCLSRCVHACLT